MLPEIRMARIVEAIGRYRSGELSCLEAAEVLGLSERHFRRLRDRYAADGAAGIVDRRLGRASSRAAHKYARYNFARREALTARSKPLAAPNRRLV